MSTAEQPGGQVVDMQRRLVRAALLAKYPRRSWDGQGDGDRLVDHFGDDLRWIVDSKAWAAWEGSRWITEGAATQVLNRARRVMDALPKTEAKQYSPRENDTEWDPAKVDPAAEPEDRDLPEKSARAKFLHFVKGRRNLGAHNAMAQEATGTNRISARRGDFDRTPGLFACGNGVLDLADMTLGEPDRDHLMTLATPVPYLPDAKCPKWLALLEELQPEVVMRDYLQRWAGYTLTGFTSEHAMALHYGHAREARRAFFTVLRAVFGEYAQQVPKSTLVDKPNDTTVPNDLARMVGRRLLVAPDPPRGGVLDEELIGQLVEGQRLVARHMRDAWFEFDPVGKVHMSTTHLPLIGADTPTVSGGMHHLIEWPRAPRDPEVVADILADELPGVLAWVVRGCVAWQRVGLATPPEVTEATEDAVFQSSALAQWFEASIRPAPATTSVELRSVYPSYRAAILEAGAEPLQLTALGRALHEQFGVVWKRGPKPHRRASLWGVELVPGADGHAEDAGTNE